MSDQLEFNDSMFAGADDAEVMSGGGGNYEGAGHYLMRVDLVKAGTGNNGEFVALEKVVLHDFGDSDDPVTDKWEAQPDRRHKPGMSVSDVKKPGTTAQSKKYFLSDMKRLVGAIVGKPAAEITQANITQAIRDRLLEGVVVEMNNTIKPIKNGQNAGKPFTTKTYVRAVPASEFANVVDDKVLAIQYGGGDLEKAQEVLAELIENED